MADERTFTVSPRSTKRMRTMAHLDSNDDGVDDHPVAPTRGNTNDDNNTDGIATNILQVVAINTEPPNEVVSKVFEMNDLLRYVVQFVGPNQFLFVATIHPLFRHIYTELFGVMTQCNVSTMDHAEFCFRTGVTIPQHYLLPLWNLAICHNRLPVLNHLRNVYDFSNVTSESFRMAVSYGHLEILQCLITIGGGMNRLKNDAVSLCSMAAQKGHLPILQFLHKHTIPKIRPWPWNTNTSYSAASNGQWSTLQWLLEQGCPYCAQTMRIIRQYRHSVYQVQELFRWCSEDDGDGDDDDDASIAYSSTVASSSSDDMMNIPANNNYNNMMENGIQLFRLPSPPPAPPLPEPNTFKEIDYLDDGIFRCVGGDDFDDDDEEEHIPNDSAIYLDMGHITDFSEFPFLFPPSDDTHSDHHSDVP